MSGWPAIVHNGSCLYDDRLSAENFLGWANSMVSPALQTQAWVPDPAMGWNHTAARTLSPHQQTPGPLLIILKKTGKDPLSHPLDAVLVSVHASPVILAVVGDLVSLLSVCFLVGSTPAWGRPSLSQ